MPDKKSEWAAVTKLMDDRPVVLGEVYWSWMQERPQQFLRYLAFYKFATKMIGQRKRILDSCSREGLGTWILAKECGYALGLVADSDSLSLPRQNWPFPELIAFETTKLDHLQMDMWDAVVSCDDATLYDSSFSYIRNIVAALKPGGIAVVNIHASGAGQAELVNAEIHRLFPAQFQHVFWFEMIGENVVPSDQDCPSSCICLACKSVRS